MHVHLDGIVFSLQKYGGISVYFQELLKRLNGILDLTVSLETPLMNNEIKTGECFYIRQRRLLERYRYCREVGNIQPTLFHSSYYREYENKKIPKVVTVHDFIYERYSKGLKRSVHEYQKHNAIKSAQAIICISNSTRDDLLEYVGLQQGQSLNVIHNGVSTIYRPLYNYNDNNRLFILYVGDRRGYKNFAKLLLAMGFLKDIYLYCVGGGSFNDVELGSISDNIKSKILHFGFVSDEELNVLYNKALCLVYPSKYEGFGIPVIEAMKAGCPVVSINCRAVLEIGGSALTVSEDDPECIAYNIGLMLSQDYRVKKINLGFENAEQFSWWGTHSKTLGIYKMISL
jgi:mannosyltransferase